MPGAAIRPVCRFIFPASCPSSWFKHSKSTVVFHCSACLLQDFCNLLYYIPRVSLSMNRQVTKLEVAVTMHTCTFYNEYNLIPHLILNT